MSRALLGIFVSGHGHRFECGHCLNYSGLEYMSYAGGFDPVAGFPPVGLPLVVLRSYPGRLLPWMLIRSRHCCEEPERVLVWIVLVATVIKVVEGCVYLRRRSYAFFGMLLSLIHI